MKNTEHSADRDAVKLFSLLLRKLWTESNEDSVKIRFASHVLHHDDPGSLHSNERHLVFAASEDFLERTLRRHSVRYLACVHHAILLLNHSFGHFDFPQAMKLLIEATDSPIDSQGAAFDMVMDALRDYNGQIEEELAQDETEEGTCTWRAAVLDVYIAVIRLLPKVVYFGLDQRDQLVFTQSSRLTAIAAASHALALSKVGLALELLEQGRAVFWNQALRLRARDADFTGVSPHITAELKTIFNELDVLNNDANEWKTQVTRPAWARDSVAKARRQSVRAQHLIEEVRTEPGLDRFLLGPSYMITATLAGRCNMVVVLISHSRGTSHPPVSEAIVITSPDQDPIRVLLPLATTPKLAGMSKDLQRSNNTYRSGVEAEMEASRGLRISHTPEHGDTTEVLKKLWIAVVKPIINAL
jgi:hypothetical protein